MKRFFTKLFTSQWTCTSTQMCKMHNFGEKQGNTILVKMISYAEECLEYEIKFLLRP